MVTEMELWVVMQFMSGKNPDAVYDFAGVFSSEEKAIAACRNWRYSYAPAILDEALPDERVDWLGQVYPIVRTGEWEESEEDEES